MAASIGEAEHWIIGNFIGEPNAAAAHDASLVVEANARADLDVFRLFHLLLTEAGLAVAVLNAEFLERAFSSLIADRAVEGMIGEKEFHHPLTTLFCHLALSADAHVRSDRVSAGNGRAWNPRNGDVSVLIRFRRIFSRAWPRGHAHFYETHAAITG